MTLNRVLAGLAVLGIGGAFYMLILDRKPVPVAQPVIQPSVSPYESFISGAGLVEAKDEDIALGSLVSGTVEEILVKVGDPIKKGQPLFRLDQRQALADLETKAAQLEAAQNNLEQVKVTLKDAEDKLTLYYRLADKRAITKEDLITRKNNVLLSQTALKTAQSNLKTAQSQWNAAETNLELYTVKSPIKGQVLQINIHPGEYATSVGGNLPLMVLGSTERYQIRVDIDENDAWRFKKSASAVAFLRGNIQYQAPLSFEYIEPYVIPKTSLTGDSTERVDTRVLQVVYSYDPKVMPAFIGQQVDVYIQADKLSSKVRYGGPLGMSR